jgi:hypothetical protein
VGRAATLFGLDGTLSPLDVSRNATGVRDDVAAYSGGWLGCTPVLTVPGPGWWLPTTRFRSYQGELLRSIKDVYAEDRGLGGVFVEEVPTRLPTRP